MTATVRYKFFENINLHPVTASNFPITNDGDDKQIRVVRRILRDNVGHNLDIGNGAGQTRDNLGCIVDIIPAGYNVLFVKGVCYRPTAQIVGNVRGYYILDGRVQNAGVYETKLDYIYNPSDRTVRVRDSSDDASAFLQDLDVVFIEIFIGPSNDSNDVINY